MTEPFILDRDDNPHPVMRAEALALRAAADATRGWPSRGEWRGYLRCMAAATGLPEERILEWLDG